MIVLVCGPPAVGKTTIATRTRQRLAGAGHPFRLLHFDEVSRRTYERLYESVAEATDKDWIVDGTFYHRVWRERFRRLGAVRIVHLTASLETCLARNRARGKSIDEVGLHRRYDADATGLDPEAVDVIYREFDPGDADLTIDTDEGTTNEAVDRLVRALEAWDDGDRNRRISNR